MLDTNSNFPLLVTYNSSASSLGHGIYQQRQTHEVYAHNDNLDAQNQNMMDRNVCAKEDGVEKLLSGAAEYLRSIEEANTHTEERDYTRELDDMLMVDEREDWTCEEHCEDSAREESMNEDLYKVWTTYHYDGETAQVRILHPTHVHFL
jgi:hypothetical protein